MLSTIAAAHTRGEAGIAPTRALSDGFDMAFAVASVFCLIGATVAVITLRSAKGTVATITDREAEDTNGKREFEKPEASRTLIA